MSFRTRVTVVAIMVVFLVAVGVWASAQVGRGPLNDAGPAVITGSDLGFLVESTRDRIPVGRIVVRVNGVWVDAQINGNGGVVPAAR